MDAVINDMIITKENLFARLYSNILEIIELSLISEKKKLEEAKKLVDRFQCVRHL